MNKTKSILTTAAFLSVLFGLMLWGAFRPDAALSHVERRLLTQRPALSAESFFSGTYAPKLESYLLDQFPLRDAFRALKAHVSLDAFRKSDNNGYYSVRGSISKLEYALDEAGVGLTVKKLGALLDTYLSGCRVFYSVIPDKNYFLAGANGYPSLDYGRMLTILRENLDGQIAYIDIFPALDADCYYNTDPHWRQENIHGAAEALARAMNVSLLPAGAYTRHTLEGFRGVYPGQSALPAEPDILVYLSSPMTDAARAYSVEQNAEIPVYSPEKLGGTDGYDVFLSGAQAIVTIAFPDAASDRRLIVFRDSFGSAMAPLLAGEYANITLVDLRYVSSDALGAYVEFTDADVLFLYGVSLINNGGLLR